MKFPVYIPTRGRPKNQITARALLALGVRPTLVVEDAEHDAYEAANPDCDVVVWPQRYFDEYEKTPELDPHPTTGAAHNFAWDHAREAGWSHHWIMDDNIYYFTLKQNRRRERAVSTRPFIWHEEWAQRWQNLAGLCLTMTAFQRPGTATSPVVLNTRLYCATLYRNDLADYGIRWRRGLNDDTIVSLDILKTGYWCTAQSYLLGIKKVGTSRGGRIKGGMTDFYAEGGFVRKSAELVRLHPDVCRTTERFGRVHHYCNYKQFTQQLIPAYTPVNG